MLFPIFVVMIVVSLAFAIPDATTMGSNLEPVLARGIGPVLRGSVIPIIIAQYLCLTTIIRANQPKSPGTALGPYRFHRDAGINPLAVTQYWGPTKVHGRSSHS